MPIVAVPVAKMLPFKQLRFNDLADVATFPTSHIFLPICNHPSTNIKNLSLEHLPQLSCHTLVPPLERLKKYSSGVYACASRAKNRFRLYENENPGVERCSDIYPGDCIRRSLVHDAAASHNIRRRR
jgi:hypothetical protein